MRTHAEALPARKTMLQLHFGLESCRRLGGIVLCIALLVHSRVLGGSWGYGHVAA